VPEDGVHHPPGPRCHTGARPRRPGLHGVTSERPVADRYHRRPNPIRHGLRVLHTDAFSRMVVGWRVAVHLLRHGPRRPGDGTEVPGRWTAGRAHHALGCRQPTHVGALHRATRRDRGPALHRDGGRFVRQCPRRDRRWPLRDRVRLRTRRPRIGGRQPPRARHPRLGPLVQRGEAPSRLLRSCPSSRVRSGVLRWQRLRPLGASKPIPRASTEPSVVHCLCRERSSTSSARSRV